MTVLSAERTGSSNPSVARRGVLEDAPADLSRARTSPDPGYEAATRALRPPAPDVAAERAVGDARWEQLDLDTLRDEALRYWFVRRTLAEGWYDRTNRAGETLLSLLAALRAELPEVEADYQRLAADLTGRAWAAVEAGEPTLLVQAATHGGLAAKDADGRTLLDLAATRLGHGHPAVLQARALLTSRAVQGFQTGDDLSLARTDP